jgi:predicted acylesterase/phospholipase RssA
MLERNIHMWVTVRPHKQYTLPMVSFLSRKLSDQCTQEMYGDVKIEDLWLRFFCVSSDLVSASAIVHQSGSLMIALTASAAVPGVTPPVLLDGRLLVDGAFLNNVPADVMRERGCGRVIASEVTVEEDQNFTCERVPTPWELLGSKMPFSRAVLKFPSMIELLLRASLLASSRRQTDALQTADLVFHPPINEFGLLEFEAIEKLERVGYEHAVSQIDAWRASGAI